MTASSSHSSSLTSQAAPESLHAPYALVSELASGTLAGALHGASAHAEGGGPSGVQAEQRPLLPLRTVLKVGGVRRCLHAWPFYSV